MNTIPEEILCQIFLHLPYFTLAVCEGVSKKWGRISGSLWRDLFARDNFPTSSHAILSRAFGTYRRLSLELLDQTWKERYLDAHFARLRNMTLVDYKYRFTNRIALTTPAAEENTLLFKFEGNISLVRADHIYFHLKHSTRRDVHVYTKNLDETCHGEALNTGDNVVLLCTAHDEGAKLQILRYRVKRKRPLIAGVFPRNATTFEALFVAAVPLLMALFLSLAPHSTVLRRVVLTSGYMPYIIKRFSNFIGMATVPPITLQLHLPLAVFVELVLASSNLPLYLDIVAMCSRFYVLWLCVKLLRDRLAGEQRLQAFAMALFVASAVLVGGWRANIDWLALTTRGGVAWCLTNLERAWYLKQPRMVTFVLLMGCWLVSNIYLPKVII